MSSTTQQALPLLQRWKTDIPSHPQQPCSSDIKTPASSCTVCASRLKTSFMKEVSSSLHRLDHRQNSASITRREILSTSSSPRNCFFQDDDEKLSQPPTTTHPHDDPFMEMESEGQLHVSDSEEESTTKSSCTVQSTIVRLEDHDPDSIHWHHDCSNTTPSTVSLNSRIQSLQQEIALQNQILQEAEHDMSSRMDVLQNMLQSVCYNIISLKQRQDESQLLQTPISNNNNSSIETRDTLTNSSIIAMNSDEGHNHEFISRRNEDMKINSTLVTREEIQTLVNDKLDCIHHECQKLVAESIQSTSNEIQSHSTEWTRQLRDLECKILFEKEECMKSQQEIENHLLEKMSSMDDKIEDLSENNIDVMRSITQIARDIASHEYRIRKISHQQQTSSFDHTTQNVETSSKSIQPTKAPLHRKVYGNLTRGVYYWTMVIGVLLIALVVAMVAVMQHTNPTY
ncbi:hypothetical protein C9374_012042 [Naegleria lovaniensis]|uniref:Uncharacterized protein n=1 Tax=Naegleria lovaniensis TaxID=51637 RepID=A0AA88KEB3_NAELO|nr:uncharacterized protein C9374_012042 [Naegleria lovaniensis]KAG2373579.1 hypothetical protein C9374_012042 [Naegleria lovaniensis]